MNKARIELVQYLAVKFFALKTDLESLALAEQEVYKEMPEGLRSSKRGKAAEMVAGHLDSAIGALDTTIGHLIEAIEAVEWGDNE